MDEFKTKIIFRKWNDNNDIIAFFPEIPSNCSNWYNCQAYEHVGQHGGADYTGLIQVTSLATESEYKDLYDELTSIGYNLTVCKKESQAMRDARKEEFKRIMWK